MKPQQVVWPSFYPAFSCIGPACSDNCCHDWPITLDRDTYLRYKQLPPGGLSDISARSLFPTGGSKTHFASIRLDPGGLCPYQDPDGGCKLVRRLGPDALGLVCTLYPRRKTEFLPGVWELTLSLSCEEALRLGVLSPDRVRFQLAEIQPDTALQTLPSTGIGPGGAVVPPPGWAQALRQGCLRLMGRRDIPISQRILAIGLLLDRISNTPESQISGLCAAFSQIAGAQLESLTQALKPPRAALLQAWLLPISHILAGRPGPLRDRLSALLPQRNTLDREGAAVCLELVRKQADPFLAAHSRETENYFTNHLFSAMFPFLGSPKDLSYPAAALAEQFALLRLLTALSLPGEPEQVLTKAMVHLARMVQHTDQTQDLIQLSRQLGQDPRVLRTCYL